MLLIAAVCHFSYDFYQFDEYYQITEFVSYKLGKTPVEALAWEYHAEMRPWLQPSIYYALARGMNLLGIENPFALAEGFRAVSGLCAWAAIVALMLSTRVFFDDDRRRRPAVIVLATLFILPYLAARTSSEAMSGNLFSLGLATIVLGSAAADGDERGVRRKAPAIAALAAGILFGLAFECRYQIAFAVIGVAGWLLFFSAESRWRTIAKLALLSCGVFLAVGAGTVADCWGYGHFVIAPWNYYKANIVLGIANRFGTSPAWWYLIGVNSGPMLALTLVWTIGMIAAWLRYPKHILTWATLAFCLAHSLVGHKEVRFLFPLAQAAALTFVLGIAPRAGQRHAKLLAWLWQRRRSRWALALYASNFLALAAMGLTTRQPSLLLQKMIYERYPRNCYAYILGKDCKSLYSNVGVDMYFYRPPGFQLDRLDGYDELSALTRVGPVKFLLITDRVQKAPEQDLVAPHAQLIYRSYPEWVENYNYLNWLERSRRYSLYEVEGNAVATGDRDHGSGTRETATVPRPAVEPGPTLAISPVRASRVH